MIFEDNHAQMHVILGGVKLMATDVFVTAFLFQEEIKNVKVFLFDNNLIIVGPKVVFDSLEFQSAWLEFP